MAKMEQAPKRAVVRLAEGDVLRVWAQTADGKEIEHVIRVKPDGSLQIYLAGPEAPPVQDPDPISDPSMKVST
jgi:hypothetical protein